MKAGDDLADESSHAYLQRSREEESLQVGSFQDVLCKKRIDLVCLANACKEGLSNNITFIILFIGIRICPDLWLEMHWQQTHLLCFPLRIY